MDLSAGGDPSGPELVQRNQQGTSYITADHLGSTRVVTDASGTVHSRHDYLPFGKEVPIDAGRAAVAGYGTPERVLQRFTGKEVDPETGLDYFGARYYSGAQGRFTSADSPFVDQNVENPQSWNLYQYGYNNPLTNVDIDGRSVWTKIGKAIFKGGDVAATLHGATKDLAEIFDGSASAMERVEAFGRVGSEFLPFSVSDAEELGIAAGSAIAAFEGGKFSKLPRSQDVHRHHMPADDSTEISRGRGPAVQMERGDHEQTKSYGQSSEARRYRAQTKEMMSKGEGRKAMAGDIKDVRRVAKETSGTTRKYNVAIRKMLDYAKTLVEFKKKED